MTRERVDVRDIMRARASAGVVDDVVGDLEHDDDDDAEEARANAALEAEQSEKRRAYHAMRGIGDVEINGPRGLEPTRYGDWERRGRVSDF